MIMLQGLLKLRINYATMQEFIINHVLFSKIKDSLKISPSSRNNITF